MEQESILLRTLIDNMPDFIFVKDRDGRFVAINQACARGIGAESPEAAIGKTDFDFIPGEMAERYKADEEDMYASGNALIDREEPFQRTDGSIIWFSTSKVLWKDREGEVQGIIGIARNITDRKESEQQLSEINAVLRDKNQYLESSINVASEFWKSVVPERCPEFPEGTRYAGQLSFHHRYQPSEGLGGDFFNVKVLDESKIGLFICDVTGHDLRSALCAAILNGLLERVGEAGFDPGLLLSELNQRLLSIMEHSGREVFVTAFYVLIDMEAAEIRYARAAHPDLVLFRRSEQKVVRLGDMCPALGMLPDAKFPTGSHPIAAGDLLLLYTDGVLEQHDQQGEEYGLARLEQALQEHAELRGGKLLDTLLSNCLGFCGSQDFDDDVCVLAAEIKG